MNKIVEFYLPDIEVCCPKCGDNILVTGDEFESCNPKYFAIQNVYCEHCNDFFDVGLIN